MKPFVLKAYKAEITFYNSNILSMTLIVSATNKLSAREMIEDMASFIHPDFNVSKLVESGAYNS